MLTNIMQKMYPLKARSNREHCVICVNMRNMCTCVLDPFNKLQRIKNVWIAGESKERGVLECYHSCSSVVLELSFTMESEKRNSTYGRQVLETTGNHFCGNCM